MQKFVVFALFLAMASATPTRSTSRVNFNLDEDYYTIPTIDGTMELMSRQQIIDHIENQITPRFDPAVDTRYILHTRQNPEGTRIYLDDEEGLRTAGFEPRNPVRLTIHGWNGDTTSNVNAVDQFLAAGSFNHIVVDWSAGAGTLNYIDARNRVPGQAKHVGQFATFLVKQGSSWSDIYVIGHSLGGQMAGLTGQYLEEGRIAACICLDPAGPLFSNTDLTDRASPDDCDYVEGIHTNGWMLGIGVSVGDSDFYPNGGKSQPGCGLDLVGNCAHGRAPELFQESLVTSKPFEAWQCTGTVDDVVAGRCNPLGGITSTMMGDPVNKSARGFYYLTTAESSPFVLPLSKV